MPRKSNPTTATLTTTAQIRAALERARREGLTAEVLFKPITDACWRDEDGAIGDAEGELARDALARIVDGLPVSGEVSTYGDYWCMSVGDSGIDFVPEQVASLRILPPPKSVEIDGLDHDLVLHADGRATAGCQTLTPKGCEQAFRALGAHLGYEIED